jgi:hypothetical protein
VFGWEARERSWEDVGSWMNMTTRGGLARVKCIERCIRNLVSPLRVNLQMRVWDGFVIFRLFVD